MENFAGSFTFRFAGAPSSTSIPPSSGRKFHFQPANSARSTLNAALADYDAAIAADPRFAVAWYDRGLVHKRRSRLAQLAMAVKEARAELRRAVADAREALARAPQDHPWRWRFEALAEELDQP